MKPLAFLCFFLKLLLLTAKQHGPGNEFFTAASDLEILLKVEKKLSGKFLSYVDVEEARLDRLENELKKFEKSMPATSFSREDESWVSHLNNAHGVLSRMTTFWPNFNKFRRTENTKHVLGSLKDDLERLKLAYPDEEDLSGALLAIVRLQETYAIPPATFSDGLSYPSHELTLEEVFEIGYLCLQVKDHLHGHAWLKEALYRFPIHKNRVGFVERGMLLEHLAWCEYYLGMLEDAVKHTKNILQVDPTNKNARVNLELYESDLLRSKANSTVRKKYVVPKHKWTNKHNILCRGDEKMSQQILNKLYCQFQAPHTRFILKPLKVEILYKDPYIVKYHDLMRDTEIEHIKNKARPMLRRACVHDMLTGELKYADYRVSKNTWISPEMDAVAGKIIAKVGHITGLDMNYAEHLQVANYGIAGQYEPHFDHATNVKPKNFARWGGNRIATMLIYLSNVEMGGRTVFTNTGRGVVSNPDKGSGVFWYNLLRNGKGNEKTQHAGCPVVLGQKWVSNLWIHENGQELLRKCSLNPNE